MNVNSQRIAAAGRAAGHRDVQKTRSCEQPSTRAASMSSSGIASTRYWRMKKTPNAVTSQGMITAQTLPVQPSLAIRMNSGTTPSWVGTAIVAMTKTSRALLPRKRSLANAKPARVEKKTTEVAVTPGDEQAVAERLPERHGVEDPPGVLEEVPAREQRRHLLGHHAPWSASRSGTTSRAGRPSPATKASSSP